MRRAITTVGLGFGDEGKGSIVDWLTRRYGADLIVRYSGGAQAAHNVVADKHHTFSQYGAGLLASPEAVTFLDRNVVIDPLDLVCEWAHLKELGIDNPSLVIHPDCLVTTPYHMAMNRLEELSRQAGLDFLDRFGGQVIGRAAEGRHGSCGLGIGETRNYRLKYGQHAIYARDLQWTHTLEDKLALMRDRARERLDELHFATFHHEGAEAELIRLEAPPDIAAGWMQEALGLFSLARVPGEFNLAILEGAQGILLDEWRGFHPHTTWGTVTLEHARDALRRLKVEDSRNVGVIRAYHTRHGAGPLPTEADVGNLPGEHNADHPWQGALRFGWFDEVLYRYAVAAAGGPIHGVAVTCLGHLEGLPEVKLCSEYARDPGKTKELGRINVLPVARHKLRRNQRHLAELLRISNPVLEPASAQKILARIAALAPVLVESRGPSHADKAEHFALEFSTPEQSHE